MLILVDEIEQLRNLIESGTRVQDAVSQVSNGNDETRRVLAEYATREFYDRWTKE